MKRKVIITDLEVKASGFNYDDYLLRHLKNAKIPVLPFFPIEVSSGKIIGTRDYLRHRSVYIWSKMNHE